jgi:hypothetical protein
MKKLTICNHHQVLQGDQVVGVEIGGAYGMHCGEDKTVQNFWWGGRLQETVCSEQAISEWILKEKNVKALTAFIWLKIGKIGCFGGGEDCMKPSALNRKFRSGS